MTELQHCALAWKVNETGVLIDMRLLTPDEFNQPRYQSYSWTAYSPDNCRAPSDKWGTEAIDKYGLEAVIFDKISNLSQSVAPNVMQRLQVDLRRFRVNGWTLDAGHYYGGKHKEMINDASYV